MSRPVVAHALRTWLAPSETFIHGQIVAAERWQPLVVARRLRDPERFPAPGVRFLRTDAGLGPLARIWLGCTRRVPRLTRAEAQSAARELEAAQVRIVHAHFGTDARLLRPLWRRLRAPLVVSFYGYDALQFPRRAGGLGALYLRPVLRESAALLAACEEMRRDLIALGADPARVTTLPWGVDLTRFRPSETAFDGGEVRFAIACRFTAKKGVEDLLRAFARVRAAGVRARLTIAGEGPLRANYERLAAELGIAADVCIEPFVPPARMPEWLGRQHLFVHPSVTAPDGDKEGTPTVVVEAHAAGLPIVATRHGGIPDVVEDGVSGHLVAEHDVEALAARMLDLARRPEAWRDMGAAGRARVEHAFDRVTQTRRREALYDRVAGA